MPRWMPILGAGILLSGLCLWLALRGVDLSRVGTDLASARTLFAVPLLGALAASFIVKAWRWQLLLRPFGHIPVRRLVAPTVVAYAGNILLPLYLGEAFRVAPVARAMNCSFAGILSSLLAERTLDLAAILILVMVLSSAAPAAGAGMRDATLLLLMVGSVGVLLIALCCYAPHIVERLLRVVTRPLPKTAAQWLMVHGRASIDGLQFARRWATVWRALGLSLLHWGLLLVCIQAALSAVQIEAAVPAAVAILILSALGMSLPNSPGFVGTIQLAFVLGLRPFGTAAESALAASIFYHVVVNVSILIAGAFLWIAAPVGSRRSATPG